MAMFNDPKLLADTLAKVGIPASTPRYVATQEEAWQQLGGTVFFNSELEDGAGNRVLAWGSLDTSVGFAYLRLIEKTTQRLLADGVVIPANGMKADTGFIWLSQDSTGPFVRLRFGNHLPGPGTPESLSRDYFDWRPPGLVAIASGQPRMGRAGEYPTPGAEGGNNMVPDDIRSIFGIPAGQNINLEAEITRIIGNMEGKGKAALADVVDPSLHGHDADATRYQDGTFTTDQQRIYYALNKQITGENHTLPVNNQGFINLIVACVEHVVHGGPLPSAPKVQAAEPATQAELAKAIKQS